MQSGYGFQFFKILFLATKCGRILFIKMNFLLFAPPPSPHIAGKIGLRISVFRNIAFSHAPLFQLLLPLAATSQKVT